MQSVVVRFSLPIHKFSNHEALLPRAHQVVGNMNFDLYTAGKAFIGVGYSGRGDEF